MGAKSDAKGHVYSFTTRIRIFYPKVMTLNHCSTDLLKSSLRINAKKLTRTSMRIFDRTQKTATFFFFAT